MKKMKKKSYFLKETSEAHNIAPNGRRKKIKPFLESLRCLLSGTVKILEKNSKIKKLFEFAKMHFFAKNIKFQPKIGDLLSRQPSFYF